MSPHRDDAAFSCGLLLRALLRVGASLRIVKVCTRSNYAPYVQAASLQAISELRRQEDERFAAALLEEGGAPCEAMNFVDLVWLDAPDR